MTEDTFENELKAFLQEWNSSSQTVLVHTSGSTGEPKPLLVEKQRMKASALITCNFLGLQQGDTALLCMPLRYIAGKMMVVRALTCELQLQVVTPGGHPLAGLKKTPDFAAMIPLQVYNSLQVNEEKEILQNIRQLIIGGGTIDEKMEKELYHFPHAVWSTYGMTETLSHIALRRLNGKDASLWYQPFDGVHLSTTADRCLIIDAPAVCEKPLLTNDCVELRPDGCFRILGRKDNIINSGGIKIQAEEVERLLYPFLKQPFVITSIPDPKFGESIAILFEKGGRDTIRLICNQKLPTYWIPKYYYPIDQLPLTGSGKIKRDKAKQIAREIKRNTSDNYNV